MVLRGSSRRFLGIACGVLVFLLGLYSFFAFFRPAHEERVFDPFAYKDDLESELKSEALHMAQSQQFWKRVEKLVEESKDGQRLSIEC